MPITIYPGTVKKRNSDGTYSDLVPGAGAGSQGADIIADEYDSASGIYSIGDYCIYQAVLYKCITAISVPEAFDSSKWEEVTVSDEISDVKNTLNSLGTDDIANDSTSISGATVTNVISNIAPLLMPGGYVGNNINFNNYTTRGIYFFGDTTSATNAPTNAYGYMWLLVLSTPANEYGAIHCAQVVFGNRQTNEAASCKIWVRYKQSNGTWGDWKSTQLS